MGLMFMVQEYIYHKQLQRLSNIAASVWRLTNLDHYLLPHILVYYEHYTLIIPIPISRPDFKSLNGNNHFLFHLCQKAGPVLRQSESRAMKSAVCFSDLKSPSSAAMEMQILLCARRWRTGAGCQIFLPNAHIHTDVQ